MNTADTRDIIQTSDSDNIYEKDNGHKQLS